MLYKGKWFCEKLGINLYIWNNPFLAGGCYAKHTKSDSETQMPCDFSHMRNLKNNQNQNQIYKYREPMAARGEGSRG